MMIQQNQTTSNQGGQQRRRRRFVAQPGSADPNKEQKNRFNFATKNGSGGQSTPSLRIIPLGGCEEVGRNMTVFEYDNDIIILDMGMQFPEEDMPGIDYIIPNIKYLRGKEKNIRAVIFSHGHLDHIGAAPLLLDKLNYPKIIGRDLTLALIVKKMEDFEPKSAKKLKTQTIKSLDERLTLGKFRVGFFNVEHSIMDAMGVII